MIYLGFSFPSSMKAPVALAVGKPTSKGLSSSTGVRVPVCMVANIDSISPFESSLSLFMTSRGLWPNNIDTTLDMVGRLAAEYCTQANPIFTTCRMSSFLDLSPIFGSIKSDNVSASYNFHACKIIVPSKHQKNRHLKFLGLPENHQVYFKKFECLGN